MEQSKLEKYITEYGRDIYSFCVFLTKNRQEAGNEGAGFRCAHRSAG